MHSGNKINSLSKKEKKTINDNKNKYFHEALNGKFIDNGLKNKDYYDKEYMIFVVNIYKNKFLLEIYYLNKHIMYMYIMDREFENKKMVAKIGYTYHLVRRNRQLCTDFECPIHLIGIKEINAESDEQEFHKYIMEMKKDYYVPYKKKNKKTNKETEKFELYILCSELVSEFNNYNVQLHNKLELEKEKTKQLQIQSEVDKEKEKTKQKREETQQKREETKQEEIKLKQEEEETKQEEIKLKQEEIKLKQLELQIELEKLKK